MIKIVTIIGARPQIIKAAALSRAIGNHFSNDITEIIVHTGQHYDTNMSQVFIDELGIPQPDYNLNVGSNSHAQQTAEMIIGIENILLKENPDYIVLYGDTNSTLAGALAAAKIHIPVVHIEAGLRSFNKTMPEEINRIMCDHCSTMLFSPTQTGLQNLINEGFGLHNEFPYSNENPGIFHCGDIMFDNSLYFKNIASEKSTILQEYNLESGKYILSTIHRDNNTDDPKRLTSILSALIDIAEAENIAVALPLHPRTEKMIKVNLDKEILEKFNSNNLIKLLPPVSFLDMIMLESNCKIVMTDSGGVQKEAYFFNKPGIILRPETEWVEIVDEGAALIANADKELIIKAYQSLTKNSAIKYPSIFGDGNAANFICETMINNSAKKESQ